MKYCSSCKKLIEDNADNCAVCSNELSEINPDSIICITEVKGTFIAMLENALKDEGIPCAFKAVGSDVYNSYNAKVFSENEYKVLVPFEYYNRAFDVCIGVGLVTEEDKVQVDVSTQNTDSSQTYEEKFEEKTGSKHRAWQMLWMILFIVGACLVIWGVDWIAHFFNPYLR